MRRAQQSGTELGALVRSHRRRLLWTQEHLADQAGVSGRTISDIERGVHATARLTTLRRIAGAMTLTEVETQQLLGFASDVTSPASTEPARFDRADAAAKIGAWNLAADEYTRMTRDLEESGSAERREMCDAFLGLGRSATLALRRHDARPAFVKAAQIAIGLGDRDRLVVAASGYSFMTKAGDPVVDADETWRTALLGISDADTEARAILTAARATAMLLDSRVSLGTDLATHALRLGRAGGYPDALAVAISAYVMATWGAPNVIERRDLAHELSEVTGARLDHVQLAGVELAACPSLELGDIDGFRECSIRLRTAAESLRHPYALAQAEMWDATLALLRGDFGEAERRSALAVSLSGHAPNFSDGHLAQMFSVRHAEHRSVELLPLLAHTVAISPKEVAWRAAWAMTAATVADLTDDVRRSLERVRLELWPLARTWTYPVTLAFLADAAWRVGDAELAPRLAAELAPYSGANLVVSTATSCEGAVDHYLGLAALTVGDRQRGVSLLGRGLDAHERLSAPHLVARSREALEAAA